MNLLVVLDTYYGNFYIVPVDAYVDFIRRMLQDLPKAGDWIWKPVYQLEFEKALEDLAELDMEDVKCLMQAERWDEAKALILAFRPVLKEKR